MKLITQEADREWTEITGPLGEPYRCRSHRFVYATAEMATDFRRLTEIIGRSNVESFAGISPGHAMGLRVNGDTERREVEIVIRESTLCYLAKPRWLANGEVYEHCVPLYKAVNFRDYLPSATPAAESQRS